MWLLYSNKQNSDDSAKQSDKKSAAHLTQRMLTDNDTRGTEHPRQQDEKAQPPHRIEAENETVGEKSSHHHAATGHVRADFPPEIDNRADDHAYQCGHNHAAHVTGQMNAVHHNQTGHIADDCQEIRHKTPLPDSQLMQRPSVEFPEQENAQRLGRSLHSHNVLEYIELSEEYGILEVPAPKGWTGKSIRDLNIRAKLGINIIAVESGRKTNVSPSADYTIQPDDILVVLGDSYSLEELQKL